MTDTTDTPEIAAAREALCLTISHRHTGAALYSGEHETLRDAVVAAVRAGADLRHADLREADLTDADLTGADLTGAKLTGAWLRGAIPAAKKEPTP